jgi:integrase
MEKIKEVTPEEWDQVHKFNKRITKEFLEQQHLSPQTLKQYESALKIFFRWVMEECDNKPIYELKPRDALRYQNFLLSRNLSSNAVKFKRSAVSSLCGFVELYYADEYPLFRNIYNKKIPNPAKSLRYNKQPLTEDEFNILIEELKKREEWQMVAYLIFTYTTGCRREESRQLLKEVVNYNKVKDPKTGEEKNYYLTHEIRCKGRGKEGKVRKFPYDDYTLEALKKWLEVRGDDDCPYMFVTKTKDGKVRQIASSTFNYWCQEIFSEIVGKRVHPHLLRSSRATNLALAENKSIDAIQKLLGHESPDTTQIYIVKENDDEIDEIF